MFDGMIDTCKHNQVPTENVRKIMKVESSKNQLSINVAKYVNPFIGTDFHGHTYPGVTVPFGMVQLSPDMLPNEEYRVKVIKGNVDGIEVKSLFDYIKWLIEVRKISNYEK